MSPPPPPPQSSPWHGFAVGEGLALGSGVAVDSGVGAGGRGAERGVVLAGSATTMVSWTAGGRVGVGYRLSARTGASVTCVETMCGAGIPSVMNGPT